MCVRVSTALIVTLTPCILYYCTCPITLRFLYLMDIHEIGSDSLVECIYNGYGLCNCTLPTYTCSHAHVHMGTQAHTIPYQSLATNFHYWVDQSRRTLSH